MSDGEEIMREKKDLSSEWEGIPMWKVFILGLGFGTTALVWTLYNVAIPVFLADNYHIKEGLIGFVMTLDNIIGFFLQPYVGAKSDKTWTRIGRRMPYIITGTVLGAIFFSIVPLAASYATFWVFLAVIIALNLSMAIYRSPVVSLMPDLVPSKKRSLANGIINLMGGASAALSLFVSARLFKEGKVNEAFWVSSALMITMLVILLIFIREPQMPLEIPEIEEATFVQLKNEFTYSLRSKDKSLVFMLFAIGSWFIAWNAVEAFFSLYVWRHIMPYATKEEALAAASKALFPFPIVFVLATLPGGYLGTKIGRLLTMKIGLVIFGIALTGIIFTTNLKIITYLLIVAGIGWGFVNVNSIVVVWEHASNNGIGTGLYYAFSSFAAITGPTLVGIIIELFGRNYGLLFPFSITFVLIAFIFLLNVKSGEAGDKYKK